MGSAGCVVDSHGMKNEVSFASPRAEGQTPSGGRHLALTLVGVPRCWH